MSSSSSSSISSPSVEFVQWSLEFQEKILENLSAIHRKIRKINSSITTPELIVKVDQVSAPLFDATLLGPIVQQYFQIYPYCAAKIDPNLLSKAHLRQMVVDTNIEIALRVSHSAKEFLRSRAETLVTSAAMRNAVLFTAQSEISIVLEIFAQDPLGTFAETSNSVPSFPFKAFLINSPLAQGQIALGEYFLKESDNATSSITMERNNWKEKTQEKILNCLAVTSQLVRITNQSRHSTDLERRVNQFSDGLFSSNEVHQLVAKFLTDQLDIAAKWNLDSSALDNLLLSNICELVGSINKELEKFTLMDGMNNDPALGWSLTAEINETFRRFMANPFEASDVTTASKIHLICLGNYMDRKSSVRSQPESSADSSYTFSPIENGFVNVNHFSAPTLQHRDEEDEKKISFPSSSTNSPLNPREKLIKQHTLKIRNGFQFPIDQLRKGYRNHLLANEILIGTDLILNDLKLDQAVLQFVTGHLVDAEAFAHEIGESRFIEEGLNARLNEAIMSLIAEVFYVVVPEITLQKSFSEKVSQAAIDLIVSGLKSGIEPPQKTENVPQQEEEGKS